MAHLSWEVYVWFRPEPADRAHLEPTGGLRPACPPDAGRGELVEGPRPACPPVPAPQVQAGRQARELVEGRQARRRPPEGDVLNLPKGSVQSLSKGGTRSLPKDRVLPAQAGRPGSLSKDHSLEAQGRQGNRLALEIDGELSAQLSLKARARGQTVGGLVTDLIARGLQQDGLRSQAEAALASLTPREQEVAWLTARGHTNPQIAEALIISPETVKTHVAHVLEKFGVRSKAELRVRLLDLGVRWWESGRQ